MFHFVSMCKAERKHAAVVRDMQQLQADQNKLQVLTECPVHPESNVPELRPIMLLKREPKKRHQTRNGKSLGKGMKKARCFDFCKLCDFFGSASSFLRFSCCEAERKHRDVLEDRERVSSDMRQLQNDKDCKVRRRCKAKNFRIRAT